MRPYSPRNAATNLFAQGKRGRLRLLSTPSGRQSFVPSIVTATSAPFATSSRTVFGRHNRDAAFDFNRAFDGLYVVKLHRVRDGHAMLRANIDR
jgi:hypothetical protein